MGKYRCVVNSDLIITAMSTNKNQSGVYHDFGVWASWTFDDYSSISSEYYSNINSHDSGITINFYKEENESIVLRDVTEINSYISTI